MRTFQIYNSFKKFPFGKQLFSRVLCFKAPYFSTISPKILNYDVGQVSIKICKRRAILNHIGTIHAIAMCNLAELCGGLAIDSVLPNEWRWIPKGMTVEYLKKAQSDLIGRASIVQENLKLGDNEVVVEVKNKDEEIVFRAKINMYLSKK